MPPPAGLTRHQRALYLIRLFPMSDDPKLAQITVRVFLKMWNALTALSNRALPSPESETAVQLLVAAYEPTSRGITKAQEKVNKAHVVKAGAKARLRDPLGRDEKLRRIEETLVTIRLPEKLLTKADLPAVSDDDGDLKNREGVAAIGAMLGPIYDLSTDPRAKRMLEPVEDSGVDALLAIGDEPVDASAPEVEDVPTRTGVNDGPTRPAPLPAEPGTA